MNKPLNEMSLEELQIVGFKLHEQLSATNQRQQDLVHDIQVVRKQIQLLETQKEAEKQTETTEKKK